MYVCGAAEAECRLQRRDREGEAPCPLKSNRSGDRLTPVPVALGRPAFMPAHPESVHGRPRRAQPQVCRALPGLPAYPGIRPPVLHRHTTHTAPRWTVEPPSLPVPLAPPLGLAGSARKAHTRHSHMTHQSSQSTVSPHLLGSSSEFVDRA